MILCMRKEMHCRRALAKFQVFLYNTGSSEEYKY